MWVTVCIKQFIALGVFDHPSIAIDNPALLIQTFVALIIFRSAWLLGQEKRRRF